ncbi:MAG: non-ribosomal peptide synthetase, partial [Sphingobacteriia bacterium]|nr:non-ribosomal peptide synthetase [Sphingobacteriia bacterium]
LLATRIISKIKMELNVDLPLKKLFEHPTISTLIEDIKLCGLNEKIPLLVVQEKPEKIPLSFAQQRLWVIDKLLPGKALYNIPYTTRLVGKFDYDVFETVVNKLIERHESFRTNFFETEDGDGYQVISQLWDFKLNVENVLEKDIERISKKEIETPFDLEKDHLLRIRLLKINETDHVLLITMHHIISDGWSIPVFLDELTRLYNGEKELSKLPISYADYAIWQRNWLKDEVLENQLNYWKTHLQNAPTYLNLPFDYARPLEMTYEGSRIDFEINHDIYKKLLKLTERTNTTLFMAMFAAINCLLHKYSGQNDIVIGAPIANRHYKETEGLIGFFVNTLALRTHFDEDSVFEDILNYVKSSVIDGYENQDIPFEYLVDQLNVERRLNVNPLFQVMVTSAKEESSRSFNGLDDADVVGDYAISKFDLLFYAFEENNGLHISIEYSTELFNKDTIERLSEHL